MNGIQNRQNIRLDNLNINNIHLRTLFINTVENKSCYERCASHTHTPSLQKNKNSNNIGTSICLREQLGDQYNVKKKHIKHVIK